MMIFIRSQMNRIARMMSISLTSSRMIGNVYSPSGVRSPSAMVRGVKSTIRLPVRRDRAASSAAKGSHPFDLTALGLMDELEHLELISSDVKDYEPLRRLSSLTRLWLRDITLTDLVEVIDVLPTLEELGLADMQLDSFLPLGELLTLNRLHLGNVAFDDMGILLQFPHLEALSLSVPMA